MKLLFVGVIVIENECRTTCYTLGEWNLSEESGPDPEDEDNDIKFEYGALDNVQVSLYLIKICCTLINPTVKDGDGYMAVEDDDTNRTQDDEDVIDRTQLCLYKNSIHVKISLKLLFKMRFFVHFIK